MLSPSQMLGVEALLTTRTQREASKLAGVSEQTFSAWMQNPEFLAAVDKACNESIAHAVRSVKRKTSDAVHRISDEMDSDKPDKTRVDAANKLLDQFAKLSERVETQKAMIEMQARLDAISPAKDADECPSKSE